MMSGLVFGAAIIWISYAFAKLEVAIEGDKPWAAALPTWRLPREHWASRLLLGGRPVTGYHLWSHIFFLSIVHIPYLFVTPSWQLEGVILSFWMLFWVLEDFLWFVVNPAYGLAGFSKERAPWHPNWWGFAPREYFIFLPLAVALYLFSTGVL